MKKSILTMALLVAGIAASYAVDYTARVYIAMGDAQVRLREATSFSDGYDAEGDAPNANPDKGIYAIANISGQTSTQWTQLATNDLNNLELEIAFAAVPTSDVVLTFSKVIGDLTIFDEKVTEGGSVTLSAADFQMVGGKAVYKGAKDAHVKKVVAPSICFNYNVLEIKGHAGKALKIAQGATVIDQQTAIGDTYSKDLSSYTGRIVVTLGTKEYQIDANPSVTVKP